MSELLAWAWLFPLPGLLLTAMGVGRRPGTASLLGPIALFVVAIGALATGASADIVFPGWIPFLPDGSLHLHVDTLTAVMLAVVGGVATCVYFYSLSYMDGDPGQRRFFSYLDWFVATMTLLVVAGNLVVLLVGWTGVGLASFLLISFWRDRSGTLSAGLEALAANAIGDIALLLAVVLVPIGCGNLTTLGTAECTSGIGGAGLLAALLVVAAMAKSAQGPLYFWIPSAMAGPTPVSALIHAATMVAAGVYLLVRVSPLLWLDEQVLNVVAVLGVVTGIFGGLASLRQQNFKRGLAYSTVSQLGYMFAGIGFGVPFAAFFHLVTHAAFKALLFLSAGVVIHATGGEERLDRLGGLRQSLPVAYIGFLIGTIAISGVPFLSGAFSKDLLIEAGLERSPVMGWLLLLGSALTGLYMGRLLFGVFHGPKRAHVHHAPDALLTWPLWPLVIGAIVLGYLEFPVPLLSTALQLGSPFVHDLQVHLISTTGLLAAAAGLAGLGIAWWWNQRRAVAAAPGTAAAVEDDRNWVDAVADVGYQISEGIARIHSGRLSRYALLSLLGVAVIIFIGTWR